MASAVAPPTRQKVAVCIHAKWPREFDSTDSNMHKTRSHRQMQNHCSTTVALTGRSCTDLLFYVHIRASLINTKWINVKLVQKPAGLIGNSPLCLPTLMYWMRTRVKMDCRRPDHQVYTAAPPLQKPSSPPHPAPRGSLQCHSCLTAVILAN